jgi:hypothetical protein
MRIDDTPKPNLMDTVAEGRCFGQFYLEQDYWLRMSRRQLTRLFAVVYPLKTDYHPELSAYHLIAYSRLFAPVEEGCEAPRYRLTWDGVRWSVLEISGNGLWTRLTIPSNYISVKVTT